MLNIVVRLTVDKTFLTCTNFIKKGVQNSHLCNFAKLMKSENMVAFHRLMTLLWYFNEVPMI